MPLPDHRFLVKRGRTRRLWLSALLLAQVSALSASNGETGGLILGVFPYLPPARLEEVYTPVAADFSRVLGRLVGLRSRHNFQQFRWAVEEGRYDIIFIQPFDYVRFAAPNGYRPLTRNVRDLKAVFVTGKDSGIRRLEQLSGGVVAMPPEQAAVSLLGRASLQHAGLLGKLTLRHERNHFACMQRVLVKTAVACVTAESPFRIYQSKTGARLRIFAHSESIPASLFAAKATLPDGSRAALQDAMLEWDISETGRRLLTRMKFQRFQAADDAAYDSVRVLWRRLSGETGTGTAD